MKKKMCLIMAGFLLATASPIYANKEGDRGFGRGVSGGGHMISGRDRGRGRVGRSSRPSRYSPTAKDRAHDKKVQNFKREAAEWVFFMPFKAWGEAFKGAEKGYKWLEDEGKKTRRWQRRQTGYPSSRGVFGGGTSMFNRRNNK